MWNHIRKFWLILFITGLLSTVGGVSAYSVTAPKPTTSALLNEGQKFQKSWDILLTQFVKDTNAAPKGSTIRIATFLWDTDRATDAVIRAQKRGVNIRMVVDPTQHGAHIQKLERYLGTDRSKRSFLFHTTGSGLHHSVWANIHAKIVTFSKTGKDTNVSYNGSGNLAVTNLHDSSNETMRRANDPKIYGANWRYIEAIIANKEQKNYYNSKYGTVTSGYLSIYYYPGAPDIIYNRLNNFNTKKACKGVRIDGAVFQFSDAGSSVNKAQALLTAAKNGCNVSFVYNYKPSRVLIGLEPARYLFAKRPDGKYWIHLKNGLSSKQYVHNKELLISRTTIVRKKKKVKTWIYAGSSNWLGMNREQNADFITLSTDPHLYSLYLTQWGKLWTHGVSPVYPKYPNPAGTTLDPEPEYDDIG